MKVLVVDDVLAVRTRLAARLAEIDGVSEVLEAACAAEALETARSRLPRVVVLDLHLRGDSGVTVLPQLRREHPTSIVVVFTNDASEHHRRQCLATGADFFFDKSGDLDSVADVVAAASVRESGR